MVKSKKSEKVASSITWFFLGAAFFYFAFLVLRSVKIPYDGIKRFSVLFTAIFFEGLPFIIIGALISSLIHLYVSENLVLKLIPSNIFLGILVSSLLGLIFPVCECSIASIIKKLVQKKLPVYAGITLLTAAPIVNPVVILTTWFAFPDRIDIVMIRVITGFLVAVTTGTVVSFLFDKNGETILREELTAASENCGCPACGSVTEQTKMEKTVTGFFKVIDHTCHELYNMGRFFITGAFLASFFRTVVPEEYMLAFADNRLMSVIAMMVLAYLLSICSETDAFIARKFMGILPDSAIMGFLITGPMIDLKNTILLLNVFKPKTTFLFTALILGVCFLAVIFLYLFVMF